MSNSDSTIIKKEKNKKTHPAVGMWKDKWPEKKTSREIARELRQKQWQRS
ncbi:MAG: hypothetical protein WD361_06905 [Gracilimonas sp.]